jgi:Secretion system C-terminal sorting domain
MCNGSKTVYFKYDEAGNRILRTTETTVLNNPKTQKDTKKDPDVGDLVAELASETAISTTQINVFPNPAVETIKVQQEKVIPNSYFELYNSKGQRLVSMPSEKAFEIDISNYPSGFYVLMLKSKGTTAQWKISKI